MIKKIIVNTIIFTLSLISISYGNSLEIITEESYSVEQVEIYFDYDRINVLLLDSDTIISTSGAGIWGKLSKNQPWMKLMDCGSDKDWKNDYFNNKKWEKKVASPPTEIWKDEITDEIVLNIPSANKNNLRILHILEDNCYVEVSNNDIYKITGNFANYNYNKDFLICGLYSYKNVMKLVEIYNIKDRKNVKTKKIFELAPELREKINLSGISNPLSLSILNPITNSIWISVWGLQYIFEIDTNGVLLDSILISKNDYISPQPPISRLRTQAVWRDWLSKWTPVRSLNFVSPSYFILQYRTGFEVISNDTIPLYSTIVWDINKQPVELEIDTHWQVAGVQADGRIIFAHYLIEEEKRQIVLNITRIIP